MTKSELRRMAREQRAAMTAAECQRRSQAIHERLLALPEIARARGVMSYVAQGGEVETMPLLRRWLAEGKRVCVPKTIPATKTIIAAALKDLDASLAPGTLGILEPAPGQGAAVEAGTIDVHVVPGLLFDALGRRLGRGAGCYDRFLAAASPGSAIIALAYDWQIVERLPADPWDILMTTIVGESRVLMIR